MDPVAAHFGADERGGMLDWCYTLYGGGGGGGGGAGESSARLDALELGIADAERRVARLEAAHAAGGAGAAGEVQGRRRG